MARAAKFIFQTVTGAETEPFPVERRRPIEGCGESIFFREWLANGGRPNQLSISSVCNCRCLFCSNHLNPFPVAGGVFRDVEDIKLQLALTGETYAQPIRLSDSLPGRIAEGEALLHPRLFEILRLIRRKFPMNLLCITTNGSMLEERFVRELSKFRPIEVTCSMHSTRPDLWARIFGKNESSAATAVMAPGLIRKYGMNLVGTIVPLPAVCGWEEIDNTYGAFVSAGAQGMILFMPGYSRLAPPETVRQMACSPVEFMDFADRMGTLHGIPVAAYPYTRGDLKIPYGKILAATAKGNPRNALGAYRRVLWLVSEAAQGGIRQGIAAAAPGAAETHVVRAVRNGTYGGNISAAGLLMADDFVVSGRQALGEHPDAELVLIPRIAFDMHLRDLRGSPAYRIAEELERPVWVVGDNGDVNRLLDRALEQKGNPPSAAVKEAMERFNRAWKDDAAIDSSLGLIAAFPVRTPWGLLTREGLRGVMARMHARRPGAADTVSLTVQTLDAVHALCTEKWQGSESLPPLTRWTLLRKEEGGWRIDHIGQSFAEDAPCD